MKIKLVEVGPRDGLQSQNVTLPLSAKLALIERLVSAGVRRLEVASFVNPQKVPQMADADALFAALPDHPEVSYIGLVLNRRGFERARAAGCREVGMVVVASDTFNRRNQGVGTEDSIAAWLEIAAAARAEGMTTNVTIAAAFGCPFEGEIDPHRVVSIAERIAGGDPTDIALADTVGVGVPTQVSDLFGRLREAVPGVPLRAHFHNTRNTGIANAYAAVIAGVQSVDASIGGLGGCPFAPAATGNIPSEDLLYMLERMGVTTDISIQDMIETSRWLEAEMGVTMPGMVMKAGMFPRGVAEMSSGR